MDEEVLINSLVMKPMRDANRDPNPAEHAVFGSLRICWPDGRRETLALFAPWGYYSYRGEYYVADFSALRAACGAALRDAQYVMEIEGN
ncbi:MAG: hypothetical protein U1E05_08700 [Patescibacteria group bacterium]|nr:hypothetical protein [Patescibacteria group bacterium]